MVPKLFKANVFFSLAYVMLLVFVCKKAICGMNDKASQSTFLIMGKGTFT